MILTLKRLFAIFTRRERVQAAILFLPMAISALLDVIGIAFVVPFMAVVANPTSIQQSKKLTYLYHFLHCSTPHQFLLILGFLVLTMLVLGNGFSALTYWLITYFINMRGHSISYRLFQKYLSKPYVYFLNKNSSTLSKRIFSDASIMTNQILMPTMQTLAKSIAVIFILGLLFYVKPILALTLIILLGGIYCLFFILMRKILARISHHLVESQEQRYRIANESFGGIKDIKLINNAAYFLNRFITHNIKFAKNNAATQVIGYLPRYVLETVAFGGVLVIVLYLLATESSTANIIPLLALYAFAGYRLLPSLQVIFLSFSQIKAGQKSLELIYNDIKDSHQEANTIPNKAQPCPNLELNNQIELKYLSFAYPNSAKNILDNLNLTIAANTTIGFVGTTGSGKTTTIDIILGLLYPQHGQLIVDNIEINNDNLLGWQKLLGYVPQHIFLSDDSIINNIAFGVPQEEINLAAVKNAAKIANIHDFITSELPDNYQTIIGERGIRLSGGQRQRIGIARSIYRNPQILILDEATSSLDGITENAIMDAIHSLSKQKTIIIIAHRLTTLKECNIIYCLEEGKIVDSGTYDELMKKNDIVKRMARLNKNKTHSSA